MKKLLLILFFLLGLMNALQAQIKLDIDFKTGDDDLERKEFQKNPEIRIIVRGKADVIQSNINRGNTWPNNSIRRVSMTLPADITLEELKEIHIRRDLDDSRGYVWDYLVKDNWNLNGLTVTARVMENGAVKSYVLLNRNNGRRIYRFVFDEGNVTNEGRVFKCELKIPEPVQPPRDIISKVPEPKTNIILTCIIGTGKDNLEGGANNVNLLIRMRNSPGIILIENINRSRNWPSFSEHTFTYTIPNSNRIEMDDISEITVRHTGGGGISADNWDLARLKISGQQNDIIRLFVNTPINYFHRFTGEARDKKFNTLDDQGQIAQANMTVTAIFGTGNDNLEGGTGNNVNIYIRFKNSTRELYIGNLNNYKSWGNYSVITINKREIPRTHDVDIDDISEVELRHTGGGGIGADNWNLDKFKLTIHGFLKSKVLVDKIGPPIHRFTGDSRKKIFIVE